MKLANPLHYPGAVFLGAIALVIGVRIGNLPKILMLPLAGAIAFVGASLREAQKPKNPALKREIINLKQQSKSLAEQATNLRRESENLLINASQIELLSTIQLVCDRAQELPVKIELITNKFQGENSLLSPRDIQRQLAEATVKQSKSSGVARQHLEQLVVSLERNLELARQGEDTRQAQLYSLSTQVIDAAGVLQQLQNQIRTSNLDSIEDINELSNLSQELKDIQENVELLIN